MTKIIPTSLLTADNLAAISKLRYPRHREPKTEQEIVASLSEGAAVLYDWITENCGADYLRDVSFPKAMSRKVPLWQEKLSYNIRSGSPIVVMLYLLDRWLPEVPE